MGVWINDIVPEEAAQRLREAGETGEVVPPVVPPVVSPGERTAL
jgi:hypothetical protein